MTKPPHTRASNGQCRIYVDEKFGRWADERERLRAQVIAALQSDWRRGAIERRVTNAREGRRLQPHRAPDGINRGSGRAASPARFYREPHGL